MAGKSEDERLETETHDLGKFHGDIGELEEPSDEQELGKERTGNPDQMAAPISADEAGSEVETRRPLHPTTADQREYGKNLPEDAEGMAIKEDAAPGADAQGS
jgi:hypothetical protein